MEVDTAVTVPPHASAAGTSPSRVGASGSQRESEAGSGMGAAAARGSRGGGFSLPDALAAAVAARRPARSFSGGRGEEEGEGLSERRGGPRQGLTSLLTRGSTLCLQVPRSPGS